MIESTTWDEFSTQLKNTLRFAHSVAIARHEEVNNPYEVGIDSWDILVGLLLAHPGESEAEQFFLHFGLVAGQTLPD